MTYRAQDVEGIVDLETKSGAGEVNGDYVRLGDGEPRRFAGVLPQCCSSKCTSLWWWVRVALLCVLLCAAAVPLVIFAGPLIIKKVPSISFHLSGRVLRSLADATNTGGFLSVQQVLYDVIGFCIAAAATAAITIYAKSTLQNLQVEDELS
ncbi:hypothetical protein B296_00039893 [Ensete ventricosum]|uniref:Uncharacterized protein n=1 Tax=Ensete ventricosum TaxID=4639 RepID=A0A426YMW9_ENSVE|nr:hypothetical protein B296_00039893 [Ensete ventricosum]